MKYVRIILMLFLTGNAMALETILSPDRHIAVHINHYENASPYPSGIRLYFRIHYRDNVLVQDSPLGIELSDASPLDIDFRIYNESRISQLDTITTILNKNTGEVVLYREYNQYLQEKKPPFRVFQVTFRVCDDGVAYRYTLPKQSDIMNYEITAEKTQLYLDDKFKIFGNVMESEPGDSTAAFQTKTLDKISNNALINLPALIQSDKNGWLMIAETGLADFPDAHLKKSGTVMPVLQTELDVDENIKAKGQTPVVSPWRVFMIGDSPAALMESKMMAILNNPDVQKNTDWIRPGKCLDPIWSGYGLEKGTQNSVTTETILDDIEFAAKNRFQYILLNENWYKTENRNTNLPEPALNLRLENIIRKAKEKNIGIFLSVDFEDIRNRVDETCSLFEKWGIAGIRIGKMEKDDQKSRASIWLIVQKTHEHKLLIQFTDFLNTSGFNRIYPNVVSETVTTFNQPDPEEQLRLVFFEMLTGRLNLNPGCFRGAMKNTWNAEKIPTVAPGTRCRQLAMYVIFESPIQMVVDCPKVLADEGNQSCFEFIKNVPTVWDELKDLDYRIGDYIVLARRYQKEWYIGGMTDWTPKELHVPLTFLDDKQYKAVIYSDKANIQLEPDGILIRDITVSRKNTLTIPLGPGGGYVATLVPVKE